MSVTVTVVIERCCGCNHIRNAGWNEERTRIIRKCAHPDTIKYSEENTIPSSHSKNIPNWCPLKHGAAY